MRFLILARDPEEPRWWSLVFQTDIEDEALDYWKDLPNDPSDRIMLDTTNFVTFKPGESNAS